MEIFEIIVGACSILSFLVSLFVVDKVVKINKKINYKNQSENINVRGNDNISSGRDSNVTR